MSISHDDTSKNSVYDLVFEAQRLLDNDQINDAIYVAKQATEADIRNALAWSILGLAYDRFGDREEAIIALKRAIMAQPDQAIYYGQLGSVYESGENWTDAFQCYDKAYGLDSSSSMYLAYSGIALINMEQVGEGIRVLEQCVELEPKNSSFQKALATAYLDSAYLGWANDDEGQLVASDINQVTLAQAALNKALSLSFEDAELTDNLKKLKQDIESMSRRAFVGNRKLSLIIGVIALLASLNGGGAIAIFYLLIVALYVGGSFIRQYDINKQRISGNKFDEFGWISRNFVEEDFDYRNIFTEINFKNIFNFYKLFIGWLLILVALPFFAIYNIYRYHGSQIRQWLTSPQNKDHFSLLLHELQSQATHSVEAASNIVANLETKAKNIENGLTHQGELARLPQLRVKKFLTKLPKIQPRSFVAIGIFLLLFIFAIFAFRYFNSSGTSINNWIDWTKLSTIFNQRKDENTSVILPRKEKLDEQSDQNNEKISTYSSLNLWSPVMEDEAASIWQKCDGLNCILAYMKKSGASVESMDFVRKTAGEGYLQAFEEKGRVDIGAVTFPSRANTNRAYVLLNGMPAIVSTELDWDVLNGSVGKAPDYSKLKNQYPKIEAWPTSASLISMSESSDGGQRFIFSYNLLNGCHACELLGTINVAFDFKGDGVFEGIKVLEIIPANDKPSVSKEHTSPPVKSSQRILALPTRKQDTNALKSINPENEKIEAYKKAFSGKWQGTYICAQGTTGLTLDILTTSYNMTAVFNFYPIQQYSNVKSGSFSLSGKFSTDGSFNLNPKTWITRPEGYSMIGMSGKINDNLKELTGLITVSGCTSFHLYK